MSIALAQTFEGEGGRDRVGASFLFRVEGCGWGGRCGRGRGRRAGQGETRTSISESGSGDHHW
jgi:hypothetical protein